MSPNTTNDTNDNNNQHNAADRSGKEWEKGTGVGTGCGCGVGKGGAQMVIKIVHDQLIQADDSLVTLQENLLERAR